MVGIPFPACPVPALSDVPNVCKPVTLVLSLRSEPDHFCGLIATRQSSLRSFRSGDLFITTSTDPLRYPKHGRNTRTCDNRMVQPTIARVLYGLERRCQSP